MGKVIKFHRKSTLTPVLDKLLSELTPVVAKVIVNPIYPLNLDDLISVSDRDSPYYWGFGVLNRFVLWKDDSTSTCRDGHYFVCAMVSEVSHN